VTLLQPECGGGNLSVLRPSPSRSSAVREDALAVLPQNMKGLVHTGLRFKERLGPGCGSGAEIRSCCQVSALIRCWH